MKILIYSLGKSGTTALAYGISQTLNDHELNFEPSSLSKVNYKCNNLIVKSIYADRWEKDQDYFDKFDKVILLIRNPLDRIVSYLLYMPYNGDGFSDDRNAQAYITLLKKKVENPESVGIHDIDKCYGNIDVVGRNSLIEVVKKQSEKLENFYHSQYCKNFFVLKYEDFVQSNLDELSSYLSCQVSSTVRVSQKHKRTERSKSFNNYQSFFLEEELQQSKKDFESFNDTFGYTLESEAKRNDAKSSSALSPEMTYGYTTKIINEYRKKHLLPLYNYGQVNIQQEGVLFDKARRQMVKKNLERAENLLTKSIEINESFLAAHFKLAKIQEQKQNYILSINHLKNCLQVDPDCENAIKMLKQIEAKIK